MPRFPSAGSKHARVFACLGLGLGIVVGIGGDGMASEPPGPARLVSWQGRPQTAPLRYRFRAGQVFAYSVEFTYSVGGNANLTERLKGTPYIQVQSVNPQGEAELFIMGRLDCYGGDDSEGSRRRHKDVWLGSRRVTSPNGGSVGKADLNTKALPSYFKLLDLSPREFILPPVPDLVPTMNSSTNSAMMFASFRSASGIVGISTTAYEGQYTRMQQAGVVRWPLVQLFGQKRFETKPGQKLKVKIDYRTSGTFDAGLGLLRDLTMSFREEQSGNLPITASAKVRLIEGEAALKAAYKVASEAWAERPPGLMPVEFKRIRVNPFLPEHLMTVSQATPGATLYHFRGGNQQLPDSDNHYYAVQVIGPGKKGTVAIQYQGSNETLSVSPGHLVFPISAQHPGGGKSRPAAGKLK